MSHCTALRELGTLRAAGRWRHPYHTTSNASFHEVQRTFVRPSYGFRRLLERH